MSQMCDILAGAPLTLQMAFFVIPMPRHGPVQCCKHSGKIPRQSTAAPISSAVVVASELAHEQPS